MSKKQSTSGELTPTPSSETPAKTSEHKFDKRWLLAAALIIVILVAGILINLNSNDNSASEVEGLVSTDNGDLKINWDRYTTVDINLTDSLTITDSGIYHLTGSLENGSVTINSGVKGEVKLILDNVTIKNSAGPAISCISGDDLVIEVIGENTLEDSASYSSDLDEDINGAIYSKADLTFEGEGTLKVTANYQDAIVGKDDVKFNSGTYNITATDDGIRGKDSVYIVDGNINVVAKQDGIKSTNDADAGKGFVLVEGGSINISAGDDAIHAEQALAIQDGTINITKSYEGIEAQKIVINGGDISVTASDDGINAGGGSDSTTTTTRPGAFDVNENCELTINGGNIYVNSGGDGVDSNGYIYFNGGKTVVDGPTNNGNGALDSGAGIVMNGGEVIAVGASGMAESLGTKSSVFSVSIYLASTQTAGTKIEIKNTDGTTILEHTSAKTFNHIAMGSTSFNLGEAYSIYLNGTKYQDFTISDIVTTIGNSSYNNMMMPPGGNRR